jgi:hypothetical protein
VCCVRVAECEAVESGRAHRECQVISGCGRGAWPNGQNCPKNIIILSYVIIKEHTASAKCSQAVVVVRGRTAELKADTDTTAVRGTWVYVYAQRTQRS